jgi:zinc finger BED domain-containing protein 5/7/8/9
MDRWLKSGSINKTPATESSCSNIEESITNEDGVNDNSPTSQGMSSTLPPNTGDSVPRTSKKRKYDESYLEMGFIETNDGQPQCVICSKVFPNSSMYPGKLRRHYEKVHPDHDGKPLDFFKRKRSELLAVKKKIKKHVLTDNENALKASYMVSYRIAQKGEAHTIAETLIKPCVIDIVTCMLDDKSAKHLSIIPLSNNTVARRIEDLASNVSETLVSRIKYTKFALQMDESTDIAGLAVLLVFVRYVNMNSFEEDLLFCKPLLSNTTGVQIFGLLDDFLTENQIPWTNCIDVCTDGARAMTGATAGAIAKIKEKSNETTSSHCILHRHALAMKNIPPCLKNVVDEAIKIVNFIKSRPLKSRLF